MAIDFLLLVGLVTGAGAFLGSMLGLGGGFIIVPLLTILLGLSIKEAVALSLLSILANSLSASVVYVNKDVVDFRLGLILETSTMLGAIAGANINLMVEESVISTVFGFVLIYVSYRMFRGASFEGVTGKKISNKQLGIGVFGAFFAGILSGLLGIGGGILKMPILVLLLSVPTRIAIGTSMFMISLTSAASTYVYFSSNMINFLFGGIAVIGAFSGAQIGSRVSLRVNVTTLRKLFGLILIVFSVLMILKGFGVIT